MGTWDARTIGEGGNGSDPDSVPSQGDYWVVSTGGSHNLDSITSWSAGDWAIYNGIEWHKVVNTSDVVSFNGRQGAVTPQAGDYTWAQIDKSSSLLSDIADIDLTGIQDGDVLKWDSGGSVWIAAPDDNDGGSGTITAVTAAAPLVSSGGSTPEISLAQASTTTSGYLSSGDWNIFNDKQDAIADFEGDVRATPITGFSAGAGTVAASDNIVQAFNKVVGNILAIDGTLTSHASDIAANAAAIAGISVPDDTDDLPQGSTNLYFTDALARSAAVVDSTAGSETNQAPSVASIKAYISSEVSSFSDGDFLRDGTRSMQGNLNLDGNSITAANAIATSTLTGETLTANATLRLKDDDGTDNYVELKAPNTLAQDLDFILPDSYGDSGDVLATDGAGNLSWTTLGGGTVSAVTAAAPLVSSGGATPEISLARASTSVPGYLHEDDFNTFNDKQDALPTGGTTAQYLRGNLTLSSFGDDVRSTPITGFSANTGTVVATDTVLQAFNKIVGNINNNATLIDDLTTDVVDEGISNLYFTNTRAQTAAVVDSTAGSETNQAPSVASMKSYAAPQAREIASGAGLSGGGDLSSNRTIAVNVDNDTIEINGSDELRVREISSSQVINQVELISSSAGLLLSDRNKTILASGDTTLTLPPAATAGAGYSLTIKNTDPTNKITIEGDSGETIDGAEVRSLDEQYATVQLLTDGTEWFITYSMGTIGTGVLDCPTGFIPVFGSSTYGTDDFCVMKYEARNVASVPTSHESDTPWVSITATNAKAECVGMNTDIPGTGGTFDLLSNDEWMTIARDAESIGSNWSGSTPGTGHMPQGWAASTSWGDAWTNSAVAPNSTSGCLYNTAANTCGATGDHKYRRTLALSTGEEIWDFSGNVWHWVDWVKGGASLDLGPTSCTAAWTELDVVNCAALDENQDLRPSNPAYNSAQGVGQFYGGSGGAALRGALWGSGSRSGAFTLYLSVAASNSYTDIGFRCVWRP